MRWGPSLLPFCLLAASCGGSGSSAPENAAVSDAAHATMNEEQLSQAQGRAPDPAKVMAERWDAMFAQPAATQAAAAEFGLKLATPVGSAEQTVPAPDAPIAVVARIETSGTPERLSAIGFAFETAYNRPPKTKAEKDAEKVPAKTVQGFLSRFQVGLPDAALGTVMGGGTLDVAQHGVAMHIAADPVPAQANGAKRRITIKFTHEASPAAAGTKG